MPADSIHPGGHYVIVLIAGARARRYFFTHGQAENRLMTGKSEKVEIAGRTVTIRPMCNRDTGMERDFVRGLSPQSKHYRFLGAVRELSAEEAARLCDIDGHNSMAYVATVEEGGQPMPVGVSRFAPGDDGESREIAVTVADDWQHHGLGTRRRRRSSGMRANTA
jgi:hypothetical protein